jgi:6-pyruvoyltetrahydropterin/6-carboxytetrahydropterin synthase
MYIGKVFHFDAAHYLSGHEKCGKVHGHTWTLEVMVSRTQKDISTHPLGMILDFHELSDRVKGVLNFLDHQLLNDILPFAPTVENLAEHLQLVIGQAFHFNYTIRIRLQEGQGGYADTRNLS